MSSSQQLRSRRRVADTAAASVAPDTGAGADSSGPALPRPCPADASAGPPAGRGGLFFDLPGEMWEVITQQGLAPTDLACLSLVSRQAYAIAHAIQSMPSIVNGKLDDPAAGGLRFNEGVFWHDQASRRQLQKMWLPPVKLATSAKAWPHLLFTVGVQSVRSLPGPRSWKLLPNICLQLTVTERDAQTPSVRQAMVAFGRRHRVPLHRCAGLGCAGHIYANRQHQQLR